VSGSSAMNHVVTKLLVDVDGLFVWNLRPDGAVDHVWWVPIPGGPPRAFREGARSNFTVDGVTYYWGWLSNEAALEEARRREWKA